MDYDKLLSSAVEVARQETGPKVDVAGDVMRTIRKKNLSTDNTAERQRWIEAAVALGLAILACIPAQSAVQTLLNPMVDMFALIERSLL